MVADPTDHPTVGPTDPALVDSEASVNAPGSPYSPALPAAAPYVDLSSPVVPWQQRRRVVTELEQLRTLPGVACMEAAAAVAASVGMASTTPAQSAGSMPSVASPHLARRPAALACTGATSEEIVHAMAVAAAATAQMTEAEARLQMALQEHDMLHFLSEVQRQQMAEKTAEFASTMSGLHGRYRTEISDLKAQLTAQEQRSEMFQMTLTQTMKKGLEAAVTRCKELEAELGRERSLRLGLEAAAVEETEMEADEGAEEGTATSSARS